MPTKGQITGVFRRELNRAAAEGANNAAASRNQAQRVWQNPPGWSGDPLDVPGLVAPFDRTEVEDTYQRVIGDGVAAGTVGDVVSLKCQGDYIAMRERALRARYASPVRCLAHAARRAGHGMVRGVFTGGVMTFAENALKAGGD